MPPLHKKHQSRSIERQFNEPRAAVWPRIAAAVQSSSATTLAVEPPWRLCVEDSEAHPDLEFVEGTFVIRDDGPTCLVSWGLVFDPEPTEAGLVAVEQALVSMAELLEGLGRERQR